VAASSVPHLSKRTASPSVAANGSLAAPIRDSDGTVVAAVNVATHAGRRSLDSIVADLLSPLLATAERIERDLASARTTAGATTAGAAARRLAT